MNISGDAAPLLNRLFTLLTVQFAWENLNTVGFAEIKTVNH